MDLSNCSKKRTLTLMLAAAFAIGGVAGCAQTNAQPGQTTAASSDTQVSTISGELTSRSSVNMNDGSRYERSTVRLTGNTVVLFTLKPTFEGTMTLLDRNGMVVATSSNSRDSVSLAYEVAEGGSYTLAVSGVGSSSYGPYQVSMQTVTVRNSGELLAGSSLFGLLTSQSRQGNVYQLNVQTAGLYDISMESDEIDSYLELNGPNNLHVTNDDGGSNYNARIRAYLEPGAYQVRAKSYGGDTGQYMLSVGVEQMPEGLQNSGELTLGSTVTGMALSSENTYQLRIAAEGYYELNMMSDDIDSVMTLSGNGLSLENDDGGSGRNSRIVAHLQPGTYQVGARGYSNDSGLYTLSVEAKQLPPGLQNGGTLPANREVTGFYSGQALTYTLNIARRSNVVINLRSSDFDTVLELSGQGVSDENDDAGSGTNSRISRTLEAGRYTVTTRAYSGGGSGLFTLNADVQPASR